ncbi:hypothetical protein [Ekhidna sp.]|uniref:hypothetical protein n=1 Tax=Ekhidna sp. TaxID=2608089 RepID=UPI003BAC61CE
MITDSFGRWLIARIRDPKISAVVIIGFLSLILSVATGFFSLERFLFFEISVNRNLFIYTNSFLHFVLIVIVLFWPLPQKVIYNEVNLNYFNYQKHLTFFKSSDDKDEQIFNQANDRVYIYFKYWKKIWAGWLGLYIVVLVNQLLLESHIPSIIEYSQFLVGTFENFFNNLASLYFIICFLVLSELFGKSDFELRHINFHQLLLVLLVLTFVEVTIRFLFSPMVNEYFNIDLYYISYGPIDDLNLFFSIISGLIAVIAIALFTGRFDSKLINAPLLILILLYAYAGLQIFIRDFHIDPNGFLMIWVVNTALFLKTIFLLFTIWLTETKRLFFYFLAVNRIHLYIREEWYKIKGLFITTEKIQQYDLTGEWEILEEYQSGRTKGDVVLTQDGNKLSGVLILNDWMHTSDGKVNIFTIEERVLGEIIDDKVNIEGIEMKVIYGKIDNYNLDAWEGTILNNENIVGNSRDAIGVTGNFILKKKTK